MTDLYQEARGRPPGQKRTDVLFAFALLAFFILHIVIIFTKLTPVWACCFPLDSLAPIVWPVLAIALGLKVLFHAMDPKIRSRARAVRIILPLLLFACAADTFTGGDRRWFEWAMRRELNKHGGVAAMQAWVDKAIASGTYAALDTNDPVDVKALPPQMRAFSEQVYGSRRPSYITRQPCGPFIMFETGGWDRGWGIMIGQTSLSKPTLGVPIWTKQLEPGVYLFAF